MKNISEIKSKAWDTLFERRWFGPIIVNFFIILLSLAVNYIYLFIETNNIAVSLIIDLTLTICLLQPFNMGSKIYMLKYIRKEEVSVGNVFDGFNYAIRLIIPALITMGASYLLVHGISMLYTNYASDIMMTVLGAFMLLSSIVIVTIINFCYYVIYDGEKVIKAIWLTAVFMLKGNIFKYIGLLFSYILWFIGIIISFGTLTFFVLPYMEAATAVYYDEIKNIIRSEKSEEA